MLRFKIKLAFRNLLKNKLYSSLIIGGFAIGFTAFILIGLFYNSEHNINTHFSNYKSIYRVVDGKNNRSTMDYELFSVFSNEYPEIKKACPFDYTSGFQFNIKDAETSNYTKIKYSICTTNDFFDVFSAEVVASLSDKPFADINSAVITESIANKLYNNTNPLGKTIKQEFFSATISAVIKDLPENSSIHADLLLNAENEEFQFRSECNDGICIYPTEHYLVLNKGVDPIGLAGKINATIDQYNQNVDSLALQNVVDIYLSAPLSDDEHDYGNSKILVVFLSISVLIILLSSINYLNYTVSMQYAKMKEIGINKTNGAGNSHLLIDTFVEVSLGVFLALLISGLLVSLTLPYTDALFGKSISLNEVNFQQIIPLFLATIAGIILLNSIAPIYVISRFSITEFLHGGRIRISKQLGKQVMLTFQLTVSIVLIALVMLIFKQLQYVKHYNLGFNEEHLVRLELPYLLDNPEIIKQETAKLPFVGGSTLSDGYPGWVKLYRGSGIDEDNFMVECIHVSDDYLETMGIELKTGRDFLTSDKNRACIMNEKAVKKYGWDTIQEKEYNNGDGYSVVGEVVDFNVQSLHDEIAPVALIYDPDHGFSTLSLRLIPGNVGQQMAQIREVWHQVLPEEPMEFTFYEDQFQAMYQKEERLAQSITFFAFIAIVLTCMGILGQILFMTYARTKEIGIRKVNGAKISEILTLLNKDLVKWVAIAFVIATPISYYAMNQWLHSFAYKTELSWWIFALSGVLALVIALLTVSIQSYKAAIKNPVKSLKYE